MGSVRAWSFGHRLVTVAAVLAGVAGSADAQLTRTYADTRVPEGGDAMYGWGVFVNGFDQVPAGQVVEQFRLDGVQVRVRLIDPEGGAVLCEGGDAESSPDYSGDVVFGNALRSRRGGIEGWIRLDFSPAVSAIGAWIFDEASCCAGATRMRVYGPGGNQIGLTSSVDGHVGIGVGVDGFLGAVDATGEGISRVEFECADGEAIASTRYAIDNLLLRRRRPFTIEAPDQMLSCVDAHAQLASVPFPVEWIWWDAYVPGEGFVTLDEGPTTIGTFWGSRAEYLVCNGPLVDELRLRARIQVSDGVMITSNEAAIQVIQGEPATVAFGPESVAVCPGVEGVLVADTAGAEPVVVQWEVRSDLDQYVALRDGEFVDPISGKSVLVAGALQRTLRVVLGPEWLADERMTVRAWAGNLCGGELSEPATITVGSCGSCPECAADFDEDGGVTGADIAAFLASWQVGEACADVDLDGGVTGSDLGAFFAAFEVGGC